MDRLKQVWQNYKEISPAFQNRAKCATDPLESDSNISSASNHDPENEYASPSADYTGYANYPTDQQASADTAAVAQNYSSPSPNQSANVARDDVNYEGSKNVSRPGSTAAQYRQPTADDVPASRPSQGKVSRPESQTSDRQQYGKQPQQQQELSRTSSVNDYNESKGKRSDSRLSRASISNEDATKLQGKEPEFGRPDGERSSRVGAGGGDSAKPDGTGSITQQGSVDQSYAQPADQYQPSDETYAENTAGYDTSQYDPSQQQQQYDPSQYEGYGDQQHNHMMHSSTPLSKYMMNQAATPPEVHSPQHNSQHPHPHPFQPPPQSHWNKLKALEMWGTHAVAHGPEEPPTEPSSSTSNLPPSNGRNSSLPRQLPQSCHFQPIHHHQQSPHCPRLSISSPSLFGTSSPESSLTPSPTSTVLKNYDSAAASPSPQASAERKQ
ncbi:hypothetical protein pipiens_004800 [Culex pipiens pipiens]|uniref:Uncharacterized protein n=1 Tax=Culex pipiens pipiens TaxID=38569 RepID=A0ABD1CET8_CULPP